MERTEEIPVIQDIPCFKLSLLYFKLQEKKGSKTVFKMGVRKLPLKDYLLTIRNKKLS